MARTVYFCGWETGSLLAEPTIIPISSLVSTVAGTTSVGGVSLETSLQRTGRGCLKVVPASGAAGNWNPKTSASVGIPCYIRFYVKVTTRPSSLTRQLFGDISTYEIRLNPSGTLTLFKNIPPATAIGTSSVALTDTTKWYLIELKITNGSQELKIDGISQVTGSDALAAVGEKLYFGSQDTIADTYTAYFDDFTVDDSAYPGQGAVVLLVPISDNARDTLWTGGLGGTTNLWKAVSNLPPTGTASETDITQIEHAGGAAGTTDRYDANMKTYSSAGIGASDTINSVFPFVWTGEDIATGDKLLSFLILSNPTSTQTSNFNVADGVSGALGTWPTGWWDTTGPAVNSPSVVINTSPVMRIIRPETASRVASCCFMGIYVDYTPATTTSPPGSESDFIPAKSSQIVSVNRASFY